MAKIYDYLNFGRITCQALLERAASDALLSKYVLDFSEERWINQDGVVYHIAGRHLGFQLVGTIEVSGMAMTLCESRERMFDLMTARVEHILAGFRNEAALNAQLLEWVCESDASEIEGQSPTAFAGEVLTVWDAAVALIALPKTATEIMLESEMAQAAFDVARQANKLDFAACSSILKDAFKGRSDQVYENVSKNNALLYRLRSGKRKT